MFADNAEEQVFFIVELPPSYKEGSDLPLHLHWAPQTTDTGHIDWLLEYTIANHDATFGNTTTLTMSDNGDGTINKHQEANSDTPIDGTGITIGCMLICRLYRDGGQGGDTFTGDAAFLSFDIRCQEDTIGSREEHAK